MKPWLYLLVLFLHSWLRWAVVGLGLLTFARALGGWRRGRDWSQTDQRVRQLFITALDSQVLLGLLLYLVLSPLTPHDAQGLREAMSVPALRFFGLEHGVMMVAALFVAHAASILSRKAPSALGTHRRWAVGLLVALVFIAAGIPWPGLPYGRPLLRAFGL